jgi:hypothetical protein
VINNPISQPRYWIGTILIAVALSSPSVLKGWFIRTVVAGGAFAAAVLFPYAAYFRYEDGFVSVGTVGETMTTKGDYDAFQMIAAGTQVTDTAGHSGGRQMLGALLFWLPRSIWPDKPINTGEMIAMNYGYGYTNISAPLWAEFWIDFGWFGVIAGFLLIGFAIRRLDTAFLRAWTSQQFAIAQVVVPILAGYSFILLRGSLLQAMFRLATILAVAWFISRAAELRARPLKSEQRRVPHMARR